MRVDESGEESCGEENEGVEEEAFVEHRILAGHEAHAAGVTDGAEPAEASLPVEAGEV
jgi:hypothetical protein